MIRYWLDIFRHALEQSINWIGESFFGLLYAALVMFISGVVILRKGGLAMLKQHLLENVLLVLVIAILAWLPFFLVAVARIPYLRWKTERERADTAVFEKAELQEKPAANAPNLTASIDGVNSASIREQPNTTAVMLEVSVRNEGSPSIADGWQLVVDIPNYPLSPILGKNTYIDRVITMGRKSWGPEDALYDKAGNAPIPAGGRVGGVLFFLLDGIDGDNFTKRKDKTLTLTFRDVHGTEVTAVNNAKSEDGPMYYPGIGKPTQR
ncbi:MAG: hypothetical protein HYS38_07320 [Acidobacteria bacterium]|nr:hypothetical protein [Acidobacteriota bacterium]